MKMSVLKHTKVYLNDNIIEDKALNMKKQLQLLIIIEAIVGINRVYLLQCRKLTLVLINIYCFGWACFICYKLFVCFFLYGFSFIRVIFSYNPIIEHIIYVITAMTSSKHVLNVFYKMLYTFDKMLNIQNDFVIICFSKTVLKWTLYAIAFNLFDVFTLFTLFSSSSEFSKIWFLWISGFTHDLEQVFNLCLLRLIYVRVLIIKAHLEKINRDHETDDSVEATDVEKLSARAQLDTSSLHEAYDLLFRCSKMVNTLISSKVCINWILSIKL